MTLMASFPAIVERVEHFSDEVENARFLIGELEKIDGLKCLGQQPHRHTLFNMESMSFYKASQQHKKKGYFLYRGLKKHGVVGIHAGMTKSFKINTYGLSRGDIEKVASAFHDIAGENGIKIG
jgi:Sep-tRNA:Cys-tRNA synthetase